MVAPGLAIDLGSATIRMHVARRGLVVQEPSVVAVDSRSGGVLAVGEAALAMIGRTPGYVIMERPVREGVVGDFDLTQQLLQYLLARGGVGRFSHARVVVCVPPSSTPLELEAMEQGCLKAGASEVMLLSYPLAGAIGVGLRPSQAMGQLVLDFGAGHCEAALLCMGTVVTRAALRKGGDTLDAAVSEYLRSRYDLAVFRSEAERIRSSIDVSTSTPGGESLRAEARDALTGARRSQILASSELLEVLAGEMADIVGVVEHCIQESPGDLAPDLLSSGGVLLGGLAAQRGVVDLVRAASPVPIKVAEEAQTAAIRGAATCLEEFDRWQRVLAAGTV